MHVLACGPSFNSPPVNIPGALSMHQLLVAANMQQFLQIACWFTFSNVVCISSAVWIHFFVSEERVQSMCCGQMQRTHCVLDGV